MRVVYLGTPAAAVPPLEALLRSAHQVVAVVTRPDRPRDRRGGTPQPSPVKQAALAAGLTVLEPPGGRDPELPGRLVALGADIGVACAFGYLLPDPVLAAFPRGIVNLHFSLLPAYRGAAPVQRALLDGAEVTGVTTFVIDAGMDTGPMLLAAEVPVGEGEDAGALTARLAEVGARLTVETLDALEAGQVEPRPQGHRRGGPARLPPARGPAGRRRPRLHPGTRRLDHPPRPPPQDHPGRPGRRPGLRGPGAEPPDRPGPRPDRRGPGRAAAGRDRR
jgi:methionyl-tRNA formyltransferase